MKKEHMQKLTVDAISRDIKGRIFNVFDCIMMAICIAVSVWVIYILYKLSNGSVGDWLYIAFVAGLMVIFFAMLIFKVVLGIKKRSAWHKGKFEIKIDKLVEIKTPDNTYEMRGRKYRKPKFRFLFANCVKSGSTMRNVYFQGGCEEEFYEWSKNYHMSGKNLVNSSSEGDEFYLVFLSSKDPVAIYNTKFFYIEGE